MTIVAKTGLCKLTRVNHMGAGLLRNWGSRRAP
jgi:hypothetical protein